MADINRIRGDDYSIFLNITDGAGVALDITGASFVLSLSEDREPTAANYEFQITGAIVAPATNGVVEFAFDTGKANTLGKFYYDIEMVDSSTKIRTIDSGTIIFKQDIGK